MKQRVAEMEREAEKLRELQAAAESASTPDGADGATPSEDDKTAIDGRSVFVGNVRLPFSSFHDAIGLLRRL
jgi:polyadenylate-binding protein 2